MGNVSARLETFDALPIAYRLLPIAYWEYLTGITVLFAEFPHIKSHSFILQPETLPTFNA